MDAQFPSNSHKSRAEQEEPKKVVKKVISGTVVKKKKTFWRRLTDAIFGEDVDSVSSYVVHDVLIPAAKNTLSDIVTGGIEMLLFGGDSRPNRARRSNRGGSYVSYNNYYNRSDRRDERQPSYRNRTRHNFDDIILESRGEAEEVLSNMVDLIEDYGMASVGDLYGFVGLACSYTDNKYGWTNLSSVRPIRVRDGYLLDFPRPMPLD